MASSVLYFPAYKHSIQKVRVPIQTATINIKVKQDRQCTCNITLRRVHVTIVAEEKQ